jgi:hypothetical protein
VSNDLLDDVGILNSRDDSHAPAAGRAGLDVDTEDAFQTLRLDDRGSSYAGVRYRQRKRLVSGALTGKDCQTPADSTNPATTSWDQKVGV